MQSEPDDRPDADQPMVEPSDATPSAITPLDERRLDERRLDERQTATPVDSFAPESAGLKTPGGADSGAESEDKDPVIPRREDADGMTVVGLGASAGGVRALQEFFEHASPDSGTAYVVVLHLSPDHESHLAEILGRATPMPVTQVMDSAKLERDHVYVIPPGRHLTMDDGHLHTTEPEQPRGRRVAIDLFFRTLADAHGPQATAVVLSGTGADGALGIKQIKERGGLTIVQDPDDAEHDGMPRSAIATGMVDYIVPVRHASAHIQNYWAVSRRMRLPHEAAPSPEQRQEGPIQEVALRDLLAHVRTQTGHDFSHYKRATILRRVGRRMQVNGHETLPEYLDFVRRYPAEVGNLVGDLLISVTQFFRDPPTWSALETDVVPRLFENKQPNDTVRAWVCGCATGEEAYTLAILLAEHALLRERPPRIQILATDMSADAIARARLGTYPDTIIADVSGERQRRWFTRHSGHLQVKKEIRETVLFAAHDALKDTPFSRLDLITCRNMLIYLNRSAQGRVLETFHFALRPDGRLLLGPSETVDGSSPLFVPTDKQHRIYVRRPIARPILPLPIPSPIPTRSAISLVAAHASDPSTLTALGVRPLGDLSALVLTETVQAPLSAEMHRGLLELYAPPSVLVSADHEILHLSERAGRFLRLTGGEPTSNLLRLVLPGLRIELRAALYAAANEGSEQSRVAYGAIDAKGTSSAVRLTVRPVREPEGARGYLLVLFDELPAESAPARPVETANVAAIDTVTDDAGAFLPADTVRQLEDQIARLQNQLISTVEQYEASNEEMKASNEELQAMNEELRSAAEELETSKEELQSVNEELTTVNQELKARVEEVSRVNGDLQNLLAATGIGTIFLDRALCVQRYTPAVESLFNIIPTDAGRPLAHLTHRLDTDALTEDAGRVLDYLMPLQREVHSTDGRRFVARVRPYRTPEDRIDGVVIVFLDITDLKQAEDDLRVSEERRHEQNAGIEARIAERTNELTDRNLQRRELMRLLLATQEEERRRIARELHDETGQDLAAMMLGLKSLEMAASLTSGDQDTLRRLQNAANTLTRKVHHLAVALRPTALDDLGLEEAIRSHLEDWSEQTGIVAELEQLGFADVPRLPEETETVAYRVVQEALTNVLKHALRPNDAPATDARTGWATRVGVVMQRDADALLVIVEDDGPGFDSARLIPSGNGTRRPGLGLAGMRERAALVDGTLTIESAPGEGTTIYLRVPLTNPQT